MKRRSFLLTAAAPALAPAEAQTSGGPDVVRPPDRVRVDGETGSHRLTREGGRWSAGGVEVETEPGAGGLAIRLRAPRTAVTRIWLRWKGATPEGMRFLGDHWERSYGDLEWRGFVADRPMPWYFLASNGRASSGYGVKTGAGSIASWQVDPDGVTLCLDVHNGGSGVELGERRLEAATVVMVKGGGALDTARRLCRAMCPKPKALAAPVYGGNNWYYTYGKGLTEEAMLRDSALMSDLAPASASNRPFMVLDMGWAELAEGAGPSRNSNAGFPDMPTLAERIRKRGARPGIWLRPLLTTDRLSEAWRLPGRQAGGGARSPYFVLDPSVAEALAYVGEQVRVLREWGFDLIKHDYTTFDITGRWGFQMLPDLTERGWRFHDRTRTTAEIVSKLYAAIREAAGDALLIGCNTIGHLGAGLFEMQRIGDDTSGREWSRTRKMGVNTLAFRLPQHGTLFAADADCVPVTKDIPWELTRQWLDLVVRSATPLFVSADPAALGDRERAALKAAFAEAARPHPGIEPLDWFETTMPSRWSGPAGPVRFDWHAGDVD
ncbi:MAG: hypothetical protein JSU00_14590 [Acidobacteria bacterium]|nr:hypothetical protein [Acidobacteriota bacterium]